jgi:chemotaxis protein MotB
MSSSSRRKHKKHEEHENHERWLVSYADFITLLFAFFTVLYATSQADLKKQEEFEKSFKQQFAGMGVAMGTGVGVGVEPQFAENDKAHNSLIKSNIESFPPPGSGQQEVQEHVERRLDRDLSEDDRTKTVTGVKHDAIGVEIQLAASKLFPSGSAELKSEAAVALDRIGQMLKESGRRVIIEGHTDDIPIKTAQYPSNWELSAARATKIVRYLAAKHKIPASNLVPVAYADQKPIVPNDSEANRARNRRIEIKIVTGSAAL